MAAETWRSHRSSATWPFGGEVDPSYLEDWGGYPVWQDEFDGAILNSSKWGNRGPSYINTDDDAYIYAENAFVSDGNLVLRTDYRGTTPVAGRAWGTGYIDTIGKFSQRYGRFEARIKALEPLKSRGIWPAFWLRDNSAGGENDVYEAVGTPCANPTVYTPDGSRFSCTFYTSTSGGDVIGVSRTANTIFTLPAPYYDFHVYACEWTPERMTNYCDGVKTLEILASTAPGNHILTNGFPTSVHIRLSQHVGTDWAGHPDPTFANTRNPNDTLVDYVRVWEYQG